MGSYTREHQLNELLDKVKLYDSNEDHLAFIEKAFNYAFEAHKDRYRLSGERYINHPLRTAIILTELYTDYITISATLVHEVVAEEGIEMFEVEKLFGKEIAALNEGLNKISRLNFSASTEAMIQSQRKIFVGLSKDVRIIILKIADRLDNMRTLEYSPVEEQKQKAKETLEILVPIAHRLGLNNMKSELEELCLKFLKRAAYDDVVNRLANSKDERDKAVLQMENELVNILEDNNLKYKIKGRSKSIYSIYKKLDKGRMFNDIYDLLALRILLETKDDCYNVLSLIHSKYKYIPSRFKDFIAMPKNNMYQSLHTTVFGNDNNMFEIQIRTFDMNELAERGIASHWSYKEQNKNGKVLHNMDQKLEAFRNVIESGDITIDPVDLVDINKDDIANENIYVYTPNGDVIELPIGATPIDFAYRIHTKVGESIVGAIVNNNIVPLSYNLESGDVVKINTTKKPTGPKLEWLAFVKTNQAKEKIKNYFTKAEKENCIAKGETNLEKEMRKKKLEFSLITDPKSLLPLLQNLKLKDLSELYHAVGSGRMTPGFIINTLLDENESKDDQILKKVMNAQSKEIVIKKDIIVEGIDEIKATLSKCCMPVFGDDIVGYITKGEGISVHRLNCPNMKESERTIDVKWNKDTKKKYKATIQIEARKSQNSLINIINKAGLSDISIESVNTTNKVNSVSYEMIVLTLNKENLDKYISNLYSLAFVKRVERIIK